jgi:hypothetical protein
MVKLINSIIAEDNMENIRQYISRGRRFEHLNIEALKQRWISAFKALASDIEKRLMPLRPVTRLVVAQRASMG